MKSDIMNGVNGRDIVILYSAAGAGLDQYTAITIAKRYNGEVMDKSEFFSWMYEYAPERDGFTVFELSNRFSYDPTMGEYDYHRLTNDVDGGDLTFTEQVAALFGYTLNDEELKLVSYFYGGVRVLQDIGIAGPNINAISLRDRVLHGISFQTESDASYQIAKSIRHGDFTWRECPGHTGYVIYDHGEDVRWAMVDRLQVKHPDEDLIFLMVSSQDAAGRLKSADIIMDGAAVKNHAEVSGYSIDLTEDSTFRHLRVMRVSAGNTTIYRTPGEFMKLLGPALLLDELSVDELA